LFWASLEREGSVCVYEKGGKKAAARRHEVIFFLHVGMDSDQKSVAVAGRADGQNNRKKQASTD